MEEEKDKLDEIFRNSLKDFKEEPPINVWENIKSTLPVNPVRKSILTRYINTAAVIAVLSALIFTSYYFYHSQKSEVRSQKSEVQNKTQALNKQSNKKAISTHPKNIIPENNFVAGDRLPKTYKQPNLNKKNHESVNNKELQSEKITANNVSQPVENNQPIPPVTQLNKEPEVQQTVPVNAHKTINNVIPAISITPEYFNILKPSKLKPIFAKYISLYNNETYPELVVPLTNHYHHRIFNPDFYIGLNYTPEYFISHSNLLTTKADFANTADLSLTLSWRRLTLRTGAGISFYNTDKYNYTVNYVKNQSIGTYYRVDTVIFNIVNNNVVPTFHTTQVSVYNQENQIYKSQFDKKYVYLQIPLIMGYVLNDMNGISFSVNAGPVLSLTMFKKEGEIIYPDNAVQIIDVQSNNATRVSAYWDMLVSLGINYRLSKKLSINLEPQYKTNIGSLYTDNIPQLKKTYSVGLRSGIMFKL